ncbi:MAG: nickel-dependent lactate racemase [Spirochaetaceae bacterium]|jgi:nickel-dependent lactate racemase|nr:nickel-dependent lactate racemase [Spirochaetaceae bacterium]
MRYTIPWGNASLSFDAPEESVVFSGLMEKLPPLKNLEQALIDALDHPIGKPPLSQLVKSAEKGVLFLVEDATRNTPLERILPTIITYLNKAGIPDEKISFLTAPGTHRVMTPGEIEKKLGAPMVKRFNVYQHDATRADELVNIGQVMAGDYPVPVEINRRALEGKFLFGLGNIVPHSDAGYSGGAKILQPGICGFVTTAATHAAAGFCPDIPLGMKEGNPCRRGMEAVAEQVGLSFILNTVKNYDGEICGIFAGDFIKAHRAGVDLAEKSFKVDIPEQADIVIVSSYPADLDFWQAGKGITAAYFAVKEKGVIIFVSPCTEGLAANHPRFREWLAKPLAKVLEDLRKYKPQDEEADLVSGVLAVCNCRARDRAAIFAVTQGLSGADLEALQFTSFPDITSALKEALKRKPGGTIGILPQGGISLPKTGKNGGNYASHR